VVAIDEFEIDLNHVSIWPLQAYVSTELTSDNDMCMKGTLLMKGLPTPITITLPPLLVAYTEVMMLLSTPVHSSTTSGKLYSVSPKMFLIFAALVSGSFVISTWYVIQLGTNCFANASLRGSISVMTSGCAPDALATANAIRPMGPAPHTKAGRPKYTHVELMP